MSDQRSLFGSMASVTQTLQHGDYVFNACFNTCLAKQICQFQQCIAFSCQCSWISTCASKLKCFKCIGFQFVSTFPFLSTSYN